MSQSFSYCSCEFGKIFGLSPKDLTIEQLNKINIEKLVEFLDSDDRVKDIIAYKILQEDKYYIDIANFSTKYKYPENILKAYNEKYFDKRMAGKYLPTKFSLLNDYNKSIDMFEWSLENPSCFNYCRDIDFIKILQPHHKDSVIKKYIKMSGTNSTNKNAGYIISKFTKEDIEKYYTLLKNYNVSFFVLSNNNISDDIMYNELKKLRLSDSDFLPKIFLRKNVLEKISPVRRLEIIETVLFRIRYYEIDQNISDLLFSISIKYNQRYKRVMNSLQHMEKKNERENAGSV